MSESERHCQRSRHQRARPVSMCQQMSAYFSMSAYISIRGVRKRLVEAPLTPTQTPRAAGAPSESSIECQHTSAYVSIRQHTSSDSNPNATRSWSTKREKHDVAVPTKCEASVNVSMRQHTSAYVSIREKHDVGVSTKGEASVNK
jgi:hypothetical protein